MLSSLFGFRGRIGRLRYFLSCIALGPALLFTFVALLFAFGYHPQDKASLVGPLILAVLAVVPLWLWTSLSLQACRIRDIGLDPTACISTWMGLNVLLGLFSRVVGAAQIGEAHPAHPLLMPQMVLGSVFGLALLFWPGRGDGGGLEARWEDAFPLESPPQPQPQPQPESQVSAARVASLPRPGGAAQAFGRRGL